MDVKDVPHIYKSFFVLYRINTHGLRNLSSRMAGLKYKIKFLQSVRMPEVWGTYDADAYEAMSKLLPEFLDHNNRIAKMGSKAVAASQVQVKHRGQFKSGTKTMTHTVFCCHSNDKPTKADMLGNLHDMGPTKLHEFLMASAIPSTMFNDTYLIEKESEPDADGNVLTSSFHPQKGFTTRIRNAMRGRK